MWMHEHIYSWKLGPGFVLLAKVCPCSLPSDISLPLPTYPSNSCWAVGIENELAYYVTTVYTCNIFHWYQIRHIFTLPKSFSGKGKTNKAKRCGLAPSSQTVRPINFILPSNLNTACEFKFSKNLRRNEYFSAIYQTSQIWIPINQ